MTITMNRAKTSPSTERRTATPADERRPLTRPVTHPVTHPGNRLGKALPAALTSEWIKLSTVRSNKSVLGLTVVLGGFVAWAVATFVTDEVLTVSEVFNYSTVLTGVIAAVTGILVFSSEAQHGTLAPALTAQPARSVIAVSKTMMVAAFSAVLGAGGLLASIGGAALGGLDMGDTSTMLDTALLAVLFVVLAGVLGLGVGMIARHSSAAISGLLVWTLVVENLLDLFAADRFSRFLPFVSGKGLLRIDTGERLDTGSITTALSTAENALVFGGYAAAALVVGTVLLHRRDTN